MEFISRERWGARHAAGAGARAIPTAEAWLHHTVTLAPDLEFTDLNRDSTDDDEAKAMRDIEAIGQSRFGYGFSYNLAIMPSGRVYVGCGVRRVGSHTGGRNTRSLGVVLVGNYESSPVPAPMKASLVELLRFGFKEKWIDAPKFDGGHRDLKQTACPGINAYRMIPEINRLASKPAGETLPVTPAPTPTPQPVSVVPVVQRGPSMIIVKDPQSAKQWLVGATQRRHVTSQEERALLLESGVPYLGDDKSEKGREDILGQTMEV